MLPRFLAPQGFELEIQPRIEIGWSDRETIKGPFFQFVEARQGRWFQVDGPIWANRRRVAYYDVTPIVYEVEIDVSGDDRGDFADELRYMGEPEILAVFSHGPKARTPDGSVRVEAEKNVVRVVPASFWDLGRVSRRHGGGGHTPELIALELRWPGYRPVECRFERLEDPVSLVPNPEARKVEQIPSVTVSPFVRVAQPSVVENSAFPFAQPLWRHFLRVRGPHDSSVTGAHLWRESRLPAFRDVPASLVVVSPLFGTREARIDNGILRFDSAAPSILQAEREYEKPGGFANVELPQRRSTRVKVTWRRDEPLLKEEVEEVAIHELYVRAAMKVGAGFFDRRWTAAEREKVRGAFEELEATLAFDGVPVGRDRLRSGAQVTKVAIVQTPAVESWAIECTASPTILDELRASDLTIDYRDEAGEWQACGEHLIGTVADQRAIQWDGPARELRVLPLAVANGVPARFRLKSDWFDWVEIRAGERDIRLDEDDLNWQIVLDEAALERFAGTQCKLVWANEGTTGPATSVQDVTLARRVALQPPREWTRATNRTLLLEGSGIGVELDVGSRVLQLRGADVSAPESVVILVRDAVDINDSGVHERCDSLFLELAEEVRSQYSDARLELVSLRHTAPGQPVKHVHRSVAPNARLEDLEDAVAEVNIPRGPGGGHEFWSALDRAVRERARRAARVHVVFVCPYRPGNERNAAREHLRMAYDLGSRSLRTIAVLPAHSESEDLHGYMNPAAPPPAGFDEIEGYAREFVQELRQRAANRPF